MGIIAGLLGAAGKAAGSTAFGTAISSALNFASQARTNAMNREAAREAFEREREAIREQNVYNSPSMQVARLMAAGLSPSMAYGANGELVGQQSDIPSYNPIPAEAPKVADLGETALGIARFGLDWREQENRDKLAQVDAAFKSASAFLAWSQGKSTELQNQYFLDTWDLRIEGLESTNEKTWQDLLESRSRVSVNHEEMKRIQEDVKRIKSVTALNDAQKERIITLLPSEVRQMDSQAALNWVLSAEGKEKIKYIAAETVMTQNEDYRHGLQMRINQQDANTRENAVKLDAAWKEYQQKYQNAKLVADTCVDIAKTVVGFAGVRELGNARVEQEVQRRMDRLDRYENGW